MNIILNERTQGLDRCEYPDLAARYCNGTDPKPVGTKIFNQELATALSGLPTAEPLPSTTQAWSGPR